MMIIKPLLKGLMEQVLNLNSMPMQSIIEIRVTIVTTDTDTIKILEIEVTAITTFKDKLRRWGEDVLISQGLIIERVL